VFFSSFAARVNFYIFLPWQDLEVAAAAAGGRLPLPQLQVQGAGPHQLREAGHVHRLQHHRTGTQGSLRFLRFDQAGHVN
jgi:hypothetical protein